MNLFSLPVEMLDQISTNLPVGSLISLRQSCRYLYYTLESAFYDQCAVSNCIGGPRNPSSLRIALHSAVYFGNLAAVSELLRHPAGMAEINECRFSDYRISPFVCQRPVRFYTRFTPLQRACAAGDAEIVELLLSCGADPHKVDMHTDSTRGSIRYEAPLGMHIMYCGRTPLHLAAVGGHPAVVKLLIAAGVDVNVPDGYGFSPLHHAVSQNFLYKDIPLLPPQVDFIVRSELWEGRYNDKPCDEFFAQKSDCVELLISAGADIEAGGRGVLRPVFYSPGPATLKLLLAAGVNVNPIRGDRLTLLESWFKGSIRMPARMWWEGKRDSGVAELRMLLEYGLNPNAYVGKGKSLLHALAVHCHDDRPHSVWRSHLAVLFEYGLNPNVRRFHTGKTALEQIAEQGPCRAGGGCDDDEPSLCFFCKAVWTGSWEV